MVYALRHVYLGLDPGQALLEKAGLVDDQHGILVGQALDRVLAYKVAGCVGLPAAAAQDSLLPPRTRFTRRLCPHPASHGTARGRRGRPGTSLPKLPPKRHTGLFCCRAIAPCVESAVAVVSYLKP